jgi:hypothetical protein
MDKQFDEERYMEVQARLREIYSAMVSSSGEEEPRVDQAFVEDCRTSLERAADQPPSKRRLADARRIDKEHRATLRKYQRAHRKWYPQLDAGSVASFWDELLLDASYAALLNESNPQYGAFLELQYALHDAIFDFFHYAYPLLVEEQMLARLVAEIREVYQGALHRSDAAGKGYWGDHAAAPLTPKERDIQAAEIEKRLAALDLDLSSHTRRSEILEALITSAHEIRRYQTPDELADLGEETPREGKYRGASQAAAEKVGKVLPELLNGMPLSIEGPLLSGVSRCGERSAMSRVSASKRMRLRQFEPTSLAMRSVDAILRNALDAERLEEAMNDICRIMTQKLEEQRRIDEERGTSLEAADSKSPISKTAQDSIA